MSARDAALAPWWGRFGEDDDARARACLDADGLRQALAERSFGSLSSGERQRVQIARTLMSAPDLLAPRRTGGRARPGAREDLVARLAQLATEPSPAGIVLVTHHLEEIPPGFTHAMLLADGRCVAAGPIATALMRATLSAAFGIDLRLDATDGRYHARRA